MEVKLQGVDGIIATLNSLPPEIVSKRGGLVRAALRKGAMVIVKQARANFRLAVAQPGKTGITISSGFTEKNIVAKRKRVTAGQNGERYIVSVNYKEHPSGNLSKRKSRRAADSKRRARKRTATMIHTNDIAYMMEYGTVNQQAIPWLRPAFLAKGEEAINVVTADLTRRIDLVVKKLATQNAGK